MALSASRANCGLTVPEQHNEAIEEVRMEVCDARASLVECYKDMRSVMRALERANARMVLLLKARGVRDVRDLERVEGLTISRTPALAGDAGSVGRLVDGVKTAARKTA